MSDQTIRLGLGEGVDEALAPLVERLERVTPQNMIHDAYYEATARLKRMHGGIVPEQYYRLGLVLGWSSKAVDSLGRRCNLERMVWADGDLASIGYDEFAAENRLGSEVDQAITDALIQGVAFGVASSTDDAPGLLHFYSALDATGSWDAVTRSLTSLLVVRDRADDGRITALSLYLPGRTIAARKDGAWKVEGDSRHAFGVPAAPLVYRPRLRKPLGRTRLTPPVRGLQDAAARELVRLEGHMDVYAYPEFWMLGADPSVFRDADGLPIPEWLQRLGRIKGIPDDLDRDDALARADVKKFDAASPSPHLAALNTYAKMFARETSLPDSSVAITDFSNPTSAESYDASQYELIAEAEGAVDEFDPALRHLVPIALAMRNGLAEVPAAWRSIDSQWRDPRYISRAAQADAGSKQIAALPWLAETEVGMELAGLSPQQIERAVAERRRAQSLQRLDALVGLAGQEAAPDGVAG